MSPYVVSALEVVSTLGGTDRRGEILRGWLRHRAALRDLGFQRGFQWLDGSFVETKDPQDLDVVTFTFRPATMTNVAALATVVQANGPVFDRVQAKARYMLDAFFIDLNASPESIVNVSRYWLGLFSHRRADDLWKGMLQVRLENVADDATASALLGPVPPRGGTP
jgi:hypothetical protein